VNVGRLAEHCALHVVMKNVLPDVGRLRWQVGPFRLELANMISEFHLAPSHLETLIAGFATKLDPTDPRSKSLLSVSLNTSWSGKKQKLKKYGKLIIFFSNLIKQKMLTF